MMLYEVQSLPKDAFPALLGEIPQPPKQLWYRGNLPPPHLTLLTVVGTRSYSSYGQQVVNHLLEGLRGQPIGIVSGLALGIDTLAHEAALRNHLYTLAVPGSGLNDAVLYPRSNQRLAKRILESGGGLLSEFAPDTSAALWTFPQRNRIMAGIAQATLIIEATEKSGTLITARMAVDYNRELLVVPGSIFSANTAGPHQFLKLGATPVTTAADIIEALSLTSEITQPTQLPTLTDMEQKIYTLLFEPLDKDTLIQKSGIEFSKALVLLMEMELKGYIYTHLNQYYRK
jgi:DNA processing protein